MRRATALRSISGEVTGAAVTGATSHGVVATMSARSIGLDDLFMTASPNAFSDSAAAFSAGGVFGKEV
jgi:hypothetical protein